MCVLTVFSCNQFMVIIAQFQQNLCQEVQEVGKNAASFSLSSYNIKLFILLLHTKHNLNGVHLHSTKTLIHE